MKFDKLQDYINMSMQKYKLNTAVRTNENIFTYAMLDEQSNQVANYLISSDTKKGDFVGVKTKDRYKIIVALLGIIKAGCVFVPLDNEYPEERLKEMIELSELQILIIDEAAHNVQFIGMLDNKIRVKDIDDILDSYSKDLCIDIQYTPQDRIYMYFTSGTTGKPKPIIGINRSLVHFIDWEISTFRIADGIRVSQFTSPCHDPYLRDIFVPLFAGGIICIPESKEMMLTSNKVMSWLDEEKINLIHCTPSLFSVLHNKSLSNSMYQNLKYVFLAGERVLSHMLDNWFHIFSSRIQLVNLYGPTETTLAKFYYKIEPEDRKRSSIPIGMPISGTKAILLDEQGKICNRGMIGEIYIRTPYRTEGYYNVTGLVHKGFIANPITNNENDLVFKTGDLARILEDGNYEFLGRVDRQVKIRGFRVELEEIENRLLDYPKIREVAVTYSDELQSNYLTAYIVLEEDAKDNFDKLDAEKYIKRILPEYMIPNELVVLNNIPVTENGKIDYIELKKHIPASEAKHFEPPKTEIEEKIYEIWIDILGVDKISTDVSFFKAGGNSITAMRLIGEIHKIFDIEIPLGLIFEQGSIQKLGENISHAQKNVFESIPIIEKAPWYEVSPAQNRMYVLNTMMGENCVYNITNVIQVTGLFDKDIFNNAMNELVKRHDAFRTSFQMDDNIIKQIVHDHISLDISYEMAEGADIDLLVEQFVKPFDLSQAPLLRTKIIKIAGNKHVLLLDMHHIISDGTSVSIFVDELLQICNGLKLNPVMVQYKDYSAWRRKENEKEEFLNQKKYWLNKLQGELPILNLPTDYQRPLAKSYLGDNIICKLNTVEPERLKKYAEDNDVTLYTLFLTTYFVLLHKYTRQNDIIIGTAVQGRGHYDLKNTIGMFVNTVVQRNFVNQDEKFEVLLKRVHQNVIEGFENQDYPLEDLISELDIYRDTSRTPIFETMFGYHNIQFPEFKIGELSCEMYQIKEKTAKYDIDIEIIEQKNDFQIEINFCKDIFKTEMIERMWDNYELIMKQILDKSICISEIEVLSEQEKNKIIKEFNNTSIPYPNNKTVAELLEWQAKKTPDKTAIVFEDKKITYAELNRRANQLARKIRNLGIKPDDFVAIMSKKSIEMIVGVCGIVKSGAAYVPIDSSYPSERINLMLEDCKPKVLLLADKEIDTEIVTIDLLSEEVYTGEAENLEVVNQPDDLVYLIYTSGSTGKPKAAMIEHKSVIRLVKNTNYVTLDENSIMLQSGALSFDASTFEIWGVLLNGGQLCVVTNDILTDSDKLKETINKFHVNLLWLTSALFNQMITADNTLFEQLNYLLIGGEKVSEKHVGLFKERNKHTRLINCYGPTENTTFTTTYEVPKDFDMIPIGRPISNTQVYILNGMSFCGIGIPGELCTAGEGVARGYLNRSELTDMVFVDNPFGEGKLYRTGDLARWMPDGNIEYLGRIDNQVKIRGYRIELEEIEHTIREIDCINDTTVIVKSKESGEKYVCAYIVSDIKVDINQLRTELQKKLPEYMLPHFIIQIEKIPLTMNGKVNKNNLPNPEISIKNEDKISTPTNEIESMLVEVWQNVLGMKPIGIDDNFFLLGGDSIKAIQITTHLKKLQWSVSLENIFRYHNIRELAPYVIRFTSVAEQGIVSGGVELTPIQSWFFEKKFTEMNHYNQAIILEKHGKFDEDIIERAFQSIILHHDALRMVFIKNNGKFQAYNKGLEGNLYDFQIYEIEESDDEEKEIFKITDLIQRSINLEEGPLVKLGLFRNKSKDKLFVCIHHLVIDSVSWRIIIDDFMLAYSTLERDEIVKFQNKTDSFQLWASRLPEYLQREDIKDEIEYWENLKCLPVAKFSKNVKENSRIKDSQKECIKLSREETNLLIKNSNKAYNTEVLDLLLTALGKGFNRWLGSQSNILINLEGHGREEILGNIDISRTVGWFTSCFPILLSMNEQDELGTQIKLLKEILRRIPNKGIGYGILNYLKTSKKYKQLEMAPEISFNYFGITGDSLFNGIKISDCGNSNIVSKNSECVYVFDIISSIEADCLEIQINYSMNQYCKIEVEELLNKIKESLIEIIEHCSQKEDVEYTPFDFGDDSLSLDELDTILEIGNQI